MIEAAIRWTRGRHYPELEAADVVNEVFAAMISDPPPTVGDWRTFLTESTLQWMERTREGTERPHQCRPPEEVPAGTALDALLAEDAALIALRRVHAEEIRKRILRIMDYMTDRQRQITRLRLFEGLTVGEIAVAMNTSSSNV